MTIHEQTGRVRVSIEISASAEAVFAALVQSLFSPEGDRLTRARAHIGGA